MRISDKKFLFIKRRGESNSLIAKKVRPFSTRSKLRYFLLFIVVMSVSIFTLLKVDAFDSATQTTWNGGVGTSTVNQYTSINNLSGSTAGELNFNFLTPIKNANWCATTNCTASTLRRRLISINSPSDDAITDANVKISVAYATGMDNEFDDIRFVNTAGDTEYAYYIADKQDGVSANVIVTIPSLPAGDSEMYLYFGEPGASSKSSIDNINPDFTDGFETGTFDNWTTIGLDMMSIADGVVTINDDGYPFKLTSESHYGFEKNRSYEIDIRSRMTDTIHCDTYYDATLSFTLFGYEFKMSDNHDRLGACDNEGKPFFAYPYNIRGDRIYDNIDPIIYFDSYYRLRVTNDTSGNKALWLSDDGGATYTQLDNSTIQWWRDYNYLSIADSNYTEGQPVPIAYDIKNAYVYNWENATSFVSSISEFREGAVGSVESAIFDMGEHAYYGKVALEATGSSQNLVKIRTSSNSGMSGATSWESCNYLSSEDDIDTSNCVSPDEQYLQYMIYMSDDSDLLSTVTSIDLEYSNDAVAPSVNANNIVMKKSESGWTIANDTGWSNIFKPYISWSPAVDSGSGIAGYCLYYGESEGATINMQTTSGLLMDSVSPVNTSGLCQYAINDTHIDLSQILTGDTAENGIEPRDKLYFHIQAFDMAHNLYANASIASFSYDNNPVGGTNFPNSISKNRKSPAQTFNWYTMPQEGAFGWLDEYSGVAGVKYCLIDILVGSFDECDHSDHPENYVGPNLASYTSDDWLTDVYDYDSGQLTTNPDDPRYANSVFSQFLSGIFMTFISPIDKAGNFIDDGKTYYSLGSYSALWSAGPQNFDGHPKLSDTEPISESNIISNQTNNFSFSWSPPEPEDSLFYPVLLAMGVPEELAITIEEMLTGDANNFSYCYSVNSPFEYNEDTGEIVVDEETGLPPNCTLTEPGQTTLDYGAYATKQGQNTLYVMSVNEAGNFSPYSYSFDEGGNVIGYTNNVTEIPFYAETLSPGIPTSFFATDISIRDEDPTKSSLQLALTWKKPETGESYVDHYIISRSTDGVTYDDDFGTTSKTNLSFIDSGLEELTYYYKVRACDDADSCSNDSEVVSEKPVGYYTSPPALSNVSVPLVSNIGNRKATISWTTDRESDSKIQFGESSGVYFPEEIGNSLRETNHVVNLTNLQPGTTYYYIAKWTDAKTCKGNCAGQSDEQTFTTLPAPVITEVAISDISIASGTVNFTTENSSKVNLYYGKTSAFGGAKTINTSSELSSYSISLSDLDDGTKYYIKINGFDIDGNEYNGNVYSFTTLARPRISNLRFQPVAGAVSNTTEVTWTTNVAATSELTYGIVGKEQTEVIDSKLVTDHKVTISNLEDDKNYILVARSRDALGNLATSDTQAFKTALDTRPPKISNVTVETSIKGSGSEARGQIIISWTTDEPATSQVAYNQGVKGNYSNKTAEDNRLSTEHLVIVSDLSTSSIYQVQAISKDKASNSTQSINQSAIIGRGTEDVFTIIFNSLRNIFGVKS